MLESLSAKGGNRARFLGSAVLLALTLLPATGCATGFAEVGNWQGVGYRFETGNSLRVEDTAGDLHVDASGYTLRVIDKRLMLNGLDHGLVHEGDRVTVTQAGRLFVNSEERLPVPQPEPAGQS